MPRILFSILSGLFPLFLYSVVSVFTYLDLFKISIADIAELNFKCWVIVVTIAVSLLCYVITRLYLRSMRKRVRTTITAEGYSSVSIKGIEYAASIIMPLLSMFCGKEHFEVFYFFTVVFSLLVSIVSFNGGCFNLIYILLLYKCHEVKTKNNSYLILSNKIIRNKQEIKEFVSLYDYVGLIVK